MNTNDVLTKLKVEIKQELSALTWEDIKKIDEIMEELYETGKYDGFGKRFYKATLEGFNKYKSEKRKGAAGFPDNLDEAANNYGVDIRLGYPRVMDKTDRFIYNAFKAGAEWMKGQFQARKEK